MRQGAGKERTYAGRGKLADTAKTAQGKRNCMGRNMEKKAISTQLQKPSV